MKLSISLGLLVLMNTALRAQPALEGIWKGTSLCQVKNAACHDEQVVYHISKDSIISNAYIVIANKIIDGKEDYMGTLSFYLVKNNFISIDSIHHARWEFKLNGKLMKGQLIYQKQLYRLIEVKKEG